MIRTPAAILFAAALAPSSWAAGPGSADADAVRLFEAACFATAPDFSAAPAVLAAAGLEKLGDGYFADTSRSLRAALMADEFDRTRHCGLVLGGADAGGFAAEMARLVAERWSVAAVELPASEVVLKGFIVDRPGFAGSLTYLVQPLGESYVLGVIAEAPMGFAR